MATVYTHTHRWNEPLKSPWCWLITNCGHSSRVLDLGRFVPFHLRRSTPAQPDDTELHTPPEQLRAALEELGSTFMKLGQMLSTRDDLLPPVLSVE